MHRSARVHRRDRGRSAYRSCVAVCGRWLNESQLMEPRGDCRTRRCEIWTYGVEQEVVDRPGPIIQALLHQLLPGVDDCDFVGLVEFLNRILRGSRIRHNAFSALLSYAVFDVMVRLPRDCQFFAKLCDRLAVTNGIEICDLSTLMQWNSHPAIPPPQTSKKSLAITILEHILPMRSALSFVSRPCLNFHFQNLLSTSTGVRYLELLWRAYPYTTMGGSVH